MIPAEGAVDRVMQETGMDRLQAIRHLQSREELNRQAAARRREGWGGTRNVR